MRGAVIGLLLVAQTVVLASIIGIGLQWGDAALEGTRYAPRVMISALGTALTHRLHGHPVDIATRDLTPGTHRRENARPGDAPGTVATRVRGVSTGV